MKRSFFTILLFCLCVLATAQQNEGYQNIIDAYESYAKLPREVVFVHTNKTTYIKGEQLGFSAYVLDKDFKKPSSKTTNLYITLSDQNGELVKQGLFKAADGKADGVFAIDSLFTSGTYTLKAFTNWMKNFKEQNFFIQSIEVLDPMVDKEAFKRQTVEADLDLQFLPEGGQFLIGVENTVGVVIKDNFGFGVPLLDGELRDNYGELVSKFSVNQLGLGKFTFIPEPNKEYIAKVNFNGQEFSTALKDIKALGLALQIESTAVGAALRLRTNMASLPQITNTPYYLAIHNGGAAKVIALPKFKGYSARQNIPNELLFPGINVFTIFDASNKPILERLYFNYNGLSFDHSVRNSVVSEGDSLAIQLQYKLLDSLDHVSISVLPAATNAYQQHHSIASYTLLQPYVKGAIENGSSYFQGIDTEKKKDLDLLLLTQGWSSYDWGSIFNDAPDYEYDFENGIGFTIMRKDQKEKQFLLHPFAGIDAEVISFAENESSYEKNGLIPYEEQQLKIGEIGRKGLVREGKLELAFKPNKAPMLNLPSVFLNYKRSSNLEIFDEQLEPFISGNIQELDEVVVVKEIKDTKLQELQAFTHGTVEKIDDDTRWRFRTFAQYIQLKGFAVSGGVGNFSIINRIPLLGAPTVYLDGVPLNPRGSGPVAGIGGASTDTRLDPLINLDLFNIAYVEVNRTGIGEGLNGSGGVIRIYTRTDYTRNARYRVPIYSEFEIPLTFKKPQKYYVPKYISYSSEFYEKYGVLGWFPNLKTDNENTIGFKVRNPGLANVKLFVEGITKSGVFVSENITIPMD